MRPEDHLNISILSVVFLESYICPFGRREIGTLIWLSLGILAGVLADADHGIAYMIFNPRKAFNEIVHLRLGEFYRGMETIYFDKVFDNPVKPFWSYIFSHGMFMLLIYHVSNLLLAKPYSTIIRISLIIHFLCDLTNYFSMGKQRETRVSHTWTVALIFLVCLIMRFQAVSFHVDYRRYLPEVESIAQTGKPLWMGLPLGPYVLYPFYLIDNRLWLRMGVALFTSLSAFPAYYLSKKLTGSTFIGALSAFLITLNPTVGPLIKYGIFRNLLGVFVFLMSLIPLYYSAKSDRAFFTYIGTQILLFLSHDFVFMISLFFLVIYLLQRPTELRTHRKHVVFLMVGVVTILTLRFMPFSQELGPFTYLYTYFHRIQNCIVFEFNPIRFFQNTLKLRVSISLLIMVGTLLTHPNRHTTEDAFIHAFAITGLMLHLFACMTPDGMGIGSRAIEMTYLPYAFCLPALIKENRSKMIPFLGVTAHLLPQIGGILL